MENLKVINELYNHLKDRLGFEDFMFDSVEYVSKWNSKEQKFEGTNEVGYLELKEYSIVTSNKTFYADIRLVDGDYCGEMRMVLSLDEISEYSNKLKQVFGENEVKVVMYDWYTGYDEPAYFN